MPDETTRGSKMAAARAFASSGHERIAPGRTARRQPAEAHLKGVAQLVASVTDDEDLIAAAWLHDIVEDTSVTVGQVEGRFGRRVAALVDELTPRTRSTHGGRAAALAAERDRLAAISAAAKTVKLADVLDTLCDLRKRDARAAGDFAAEVRELPRVLDAGDTRLGERLAREIERCDVPAGGAAASSRGTGQRRLTVPLTALRAFERAFSADDIAEPLLSFDEERNGRAVADALTQAGVLVAGVRTDGFVSGYVEAVELGDAPCGAAQRPFMPAQVVPRDAPLADVIDVLTVHDWCFVTTFGSVAGVISRQDVQKPAVRMWLFGIITVAEMEATRHLARTWPADTWTTLVSPARLAKAQQLLEERQRRNERCALVDCLQLSDKLDVVMADETLRTSFGLPTGTAARRIGQQIERLRNTLAHSQPLDEDDWPQIVRFARRVATFEQT